MPGMPQLRGGGGALGRAIHLPKDVSSGAESPSSAVALVFSVSCAWRARAHFRAASGPDLDRAAEKPATEETRRPLVVVAVLVVVVVLLLLLSLTMLLVLLSLTAEAPSPTPANAIIISSCCGCCLGRRHWRESNKEAPP